MTCNLVVKTPWPIEWTVIKLMLRVLLLRDVKNKWHGRVVLFPFHAIFIAVMFFFWGSSVKSFALFQVCYARVLDYRRKFIEAAQRYNELSYKSIVHESERLEALKHALHCTILASAGKTKVVRLFLDRRFFFFYQCMPNKGRASKYIPEMFIAFLLSFQDNSDPGCWPLSSKMRGASSLQPMGFWKKCIWIGLFEGTSCKNLLQCSCRTKKPQQLMVVPASRF